MLGKVGHDIASPRTLSVSFHETVNTVCVKTDMDIISELMIFMMYCRKKNYENDEKVTILRK